MNNMKSAYFVNLHLLLGIFWTVIGAVTEVELTQTIGFINLCAASVIWNVSSIVSNKTLDTDKSE